MYHCAKNQTVCVPLYREPNGSCTILSKTKRFTHHFAKPPGLRYYVQELTRNVGTPSAMLVFLVLHSCIIFFGPKFAFQQTFFVCFNSRLLLSSLKTVLSDISNLPLILFRVARLFDISLYNADIQLVSSCIKLSLGVFSTSLWLCNSNSILIAISSKCLVASFFRFNLI